MIILLLSGILIGYVVAMPPGPVTVTFFSLNLKKSLREILFFILAIGLTDIFYCFFSFNVSSSVFKYISYTSTNQNPVVFSIQILLVLILFSAGAILIRKSRKTDNIIDNNETLSSKYQWIKTNNLFLYGFGISLTNLINPAFIPSLVIICGTVINLKVVNPDISSNLFFSIGFGTGTFLWLLSLNRIFYSDKMQKHKNNKMITKALPGTLFILSGLILLFKVIMYSNK